MKSASLLLAAAAFLPALAPAQRPAPVSDDEAAVVYMQSRMVPATFALCAQYYPGAKRDYDIALAAWMLENSAVIQRGEAHARAQVQAQGQDLDTALADEGKRLDDTIRSLPAKEREGLCERLLQTTRDES